MKDKAILVIDMPESCAECRLRFIYGSVHFCTAYEKRYDVWSQVWNNTKPVWCPFKPMPEKYDIPSDDFEYEIGFNRCIDEILGGEE